jgi:hypothetical protein
MAYHLDQVWVSPQTYPMASQDPCSLGARLPSPCQVPYLTDFQDSQAHHLQVVLRQRNPQSTPKCIQDSVPPSAVPSNRRTRSNHPRHKAHSRHNSAASRMDPSHHPLWHIRLKITLVSSPHSIHSNRLQWDSSPALLRIYST